MTTTTFGLLDAILVSDLPPVSEQRTTLSFRVRAYTQRLRQERSFDRALRAAAPGEHADIIAAGRRG